MLRKRQSKNVEDERHSRLEIGDRLLSARDAANETLRNMYGTAGAISVKQKQNAKALGLSKSLEDAQNIANKSQARLRRRMK